MIRGAAFVAALLALVLALLALAGCTQSNEDRVAEFKRCQDAGMRAVETGAVYRKVVCEPPPGMYYAMVEASSVTRDAFRKRYEALACADGRLARTEPACVEWSARSREARQ